MSLPDSIPRILAQAEVTAVSLEFGTVPPDEVFFAMQAENWLHHRASADHARWDEIKTGLQRAFYPDSDEWRHQVWSHSQRILEPLLREGGP